MVNVVPLVEAEANGSQDPDQEQAEQQQQQQQQEQQGKQSHVQMSAGHSGQIQRILNSINKAWEIPDVNAFLAPANCPASWTERPAKALSKLANATQREHRDWALDLLQQNAGDSPLSKQIIESVLETARRQGKVSSARSIRTASPANPSSAGPQQKSLPPPPPPPLHPTPAPPPILRLRRSARTSHGPENPSSSLASLSSSHASSHSNLHRSVENQPDQGSEPEHPEVLAGRGRADSPDLTGGNSASSHRHYLTSPVPSSASQNLRRQSIVAAAKAAEMSTSASTNQHGTPPPDSSDPHGDSASYTRTKRKFDEFDKCMEGARDALNRNITHCKHEVNVHQAKKTALKYELQIQDPNNHAAAIDQIDTEINESQSTLTEAQRLLASLGRNIDGASPRARQALVECNHQKGLTHSTSHDDSALGDVSMLTSTTSPSDSDSHELSPPLPEHCSACLWARWMTAARARVQTQEKRMEDLQFRRDEEIKNRDDQAVRRQEATVELAELDGKIKDLEASISLAQDKLAGVERLCE